MRAKAGGSTGSVGILFKKVKRKSGVLTKLFYPWKRKMQVNSFLSLAVFKDISQEQALSSGCGMVMREFPKS